jgi:hypothetical protein
LTDSGPRSRIVLLNRLVSSSISRATIVGSKLPTHSASDLFGHIQKRIENGVCIEYFDTDDVNEEDPVRIAANVGKNLVRVSRIEIAKSASGGYCTFLVDFIDSSISSFPVVDIRSFDGRELSGNATERGAHAAHVVVKLPAEGEADDGMYRCVIEAVPNVTRQNIEYLLGRQLRRIAKAGDWVVMSQEANQKGQPVAKAKSYYAKLELMADVGRQSGGTMGPENLTKMVFTKRSEKLSIAQATSVIHQDVYGDARYQVPASQAPKDPNEKVKWFKALRESYENRGFTTKLYFRHLSGGEVSGTLNPSLDGAADLLMCQREIIDLEGERKFWVGTIQPHTRDKLKAILDKDELWEKTK